MRKLGWTLYVVGVCVGAAGGTAIPVLWPVLGLGVVLVVGGTVLIRKKDDVASKQGTPGEGAGSEGTLAGQKAHLVALKEGTAALDQEAEGMALADLQGRVEALQNERVLPFANHRQVLIDRLGMAAFADIMGPFATGERYLNRTWSAAVDDHGQEARAALAHAAASFTEASEAIGKAS